MLLDTYNNGIYIIDIEAKAKVAVATDIKLWADNKLISYRKDTFTEKIMVPWKDLMVFYIEI